MIVMGKATGLHGCGFHRVDFITIRVSQGGLWRWGRVWKGRCARGG